MSLGLRMLLGCVLPLALIFLLPLVGISETVTVFVFIVLMFACHLGMMGHHKHGSSETHQRPANGDHLHEQD